jgi:Super-infection exclusion protein B
VSVEKILDALKLGPRQFATALVAGCVFLGLPPSAISFLGLASIMSVTRPWVAVASILSGAGLLVHGFAGLYSRRVKKRLATKERRTQENRLHHLTPEEKKFLAVFISHPSRTRRADMDDDLPLELERGGIVHRLTEKPTRFGFHNWSVEPWAWEYLQRQPQLLEAPGQDNAT